MSPFTWLRSQVKAAFLGGIEDAVKELSEGKAPPVAIAGEETKAIVAAEQLAEDEQPPRRSGRGKGV